MNSWSPSPATRRQWRFISPCAAYFTGLPSGWIEGGYPTTTPVAVIYKATWPESQSVRRTLADIGDKVRETGIRKTALILAPGNFLGMSITLKTLLCGERTSHEYRKA